VQSHDNDHQKLIRIFTNVLVYSKVDPGRGESDVEEYIIHLELHVCLQTGSAE